MIITCPECDRRYMTDNQSLGDVGRDVRCVGCGHQWFQENIHIPEQTDVLNLGLEEPEEENTGSILKKLIFVFVFLGLIVASFSFVVFKREWVMRLIPESKIIFENMGFSSKKTNLSIVMDNIATLQKTDKGVVQFFLVGDIKNIAEGIRQIPPLKVKVMGRCDAASWTSKIEAKLKGDTECTLDQWQHDWHETRLPAGEKLSFETQSRPQIEGMQNIRVDF